MFVCACVFVYDLMCVSCACVYLVAVMVMASSTYSTVPRRSLVGSDTLSPDAKYNHLQYKIHFSFAHYGHCIRIFIFFIIKSKLNERWRNIVKYCEILRVFSHRYSALLF